MSSRPHDPGSGIPTPEGEQYNTYVGRIARGAGISLSGQGLGRVLNYATQIALAWMYGPTQLGLYVLGITLIQMSNVLAQFGMDNGVVRYVAHYRTEEDDSRVRGIILLALWAPFALSVVLAALMFFGAGYLAGNLFDKPTLEIVLKIFSLSLPFFTLMNMAVYATVGFQSVKRLILVQQILQPLINLVFILVFFFAGAEILGAVVAYILSMLAGSILALYYLRQVFPKLTDRGSPTKFETWALFNASWPLILSSFTQRINSWTAVTVLGIFASASAVGIYNTAARTAMLSALVLFAFNGIFSPIISSLYRSNRLEDLSRLYRDVSRWVFAGGLAVFIVTVVLGKDILAVLGPAFVSGWAALVIISVAQLFNSSVGPTQRVLAMTRHQKVLMVANVGSAIAGVVLSVVLVPPYGILGAAAATAAAIFLMNAFTLLSVRRLLGFWPYNRLYLKPTAAGLLAAAGVYLGKSVLSLPTGIPNVVVFGPLFMIFFAGLIFIFGLGPSDRELLASLWKSVRHVTQRGARTASG